MEKVVHIELKGEKHGITLPGFAERDELAVASYRASEAGGAASMRVCAAAVGLCTRIGARSKVSYEGCGANPFTYGGRIYDWLRKQGVERAEIAAAGNIVLSLVADCLAPREPEVAAATDFSEGGGVSTQPPSA